MERLTRNKQRFDELLQATLARAKTLDERIAALEAKEDALKRKIAESQPEPLVYLDVGGVEYNTTNTTLTKVPGSLLEIMFSGRHKLVKDDAQNYFIDRDGLLFRHVINYLRDGSISLATDPLELAFVKQEFEYFGLSFERNSAPVVAESSRKPAPLSIELSPLSSLSQVLDEREKIISEGEKQLAERIAAIEKEREIITRINEANEDIIPLNVGGVKMKTTRSTLCSAKDSMLEALFKSDSKHTITRDRQGITFLDRDGIRFRVVLNVLRNLHSSPPLRVPLSEELRGEFERLCIDLPSHLKPISHLLLDVDSFSGDERSFSLSDDCLSFTKLSTGHCVIYAKSPLPPSLSFRVQLHTQLASPGWLLIGVDNSCSHSTATYPSNYSSSFGMNVSTTGDSGMWIKGKYKRMETLIARGGDVLSVQVTPTSFEVSCGTSWMQRIDLPADGVWYLHFNPHSASFTILP